MEAKIEVLEQRNSGALLFTDKPLLLQLAPFRIQSAEDAQQAFTSSESVFFKLAAAQAGKATTRVFD